MLNSSLRRDTGSNGGRRAADGDGEAGAAAAAGTDNGNGGTSGTLNTASASEGGSGKGEVGVGGLPLGVRLEEVGGLESYGQVRHVRTMSVIIRNSLDFST